MTNLIIEVLKNNGHAKETEYVLADFVVAILQGDEKVIDFFEDICYTEEELEKLTKKYFEHL